MSDIDSRLRAVETQLAKLNALVEDNLTRLNRAVENHERHLYGSLESPGLTLQVDRLNRSAATARWGIRVALASAATAVGCYIATFF